MEFNKKVKEYFKSKNLTNRDVSNLMDGYSESMISKILNRDTISNNFIEKLVDKFPDMDMNYMFKDDAQRVESFKNQNENKNRAMELVREIKLKTSELESILAQNWH